MSFSVFPFDFETVAADKLNVAWQFPSAMSDRDYFNDSIPPITMENEFKVNALRLAARISPTDPGGGVALTLALLKNGVLQSSISLNSGEALASKLITPVTFAVGDIMLCRVDRIGGGRPGVGVTFSARSPVI